MTNDAIFEAIRQYIEQDKELSKIFYVEATLVRARGDSRLDMVLISRHDVEFAVPAEECLSNLSLIIIALNMPSKLALSEEGADEELSKMQSIRDEIFKLATRIFIAELETDLDCNFNRAVEELQEHQDEMRQNAIKEAEDVEDSRREYEESSCERECNNDAFDAYDKICNGK